MEIVVIGAGASGLMAAIQAAASGARVTVLDGMEKPGKKLLTTGNALQSDESERRAHSGLPGKKPGACRGHCESLSARGDPGVF